MNVPSDRLHPQASILIILMGSLGDVARGIAVLAPLKAKYPQAKITWLVEPKCEAFIKVHPMVDNIIVFNRPRGLKGVLELRKEFKKHSFDVCLDLQRHFKSGLFSALSGAPYRLGFSKKNAKEFNWLFNNDHIKAYPSNYPKFKHYLAFLEHLGIKDLEHLDFGLGAIDYESLGADKLALSPKPFIVLVMGSSWPSKDWTLEGYIGLSKLILREFKHSVLLVGDASQVASAKAVCEAVQDERLQDLVGQTSLPELISLLKEADIAVGPDSGPGHIAAALQTPYIALFGATDAARVAPYANEHLVINAQLDCSPCLKRECPGLNGVCMHSISPEMVLEKLKMLA